MNIRQSGLIAMSVIALLAGTACSGSVLRDGRGNAVKDPAGLLASVDLGESDTLLPLGDAIGDAGLLAAAEKALADAADGDLKWAATWVVVNSFGDADLLVPLAADADLTIRVMAATGLLAQGRIEGFDPLINALTNEEFLIGRYPPEPAWSAATLALVRWTAVSDNGPPFDANTDQLAAAQARWQAWFVNHQQSLHFDTNEGIWVTV